MQEEQTTAPKEAVATVEQANAPNRSRHPLFYLLLLMGLFYLGSYNGIWTSNDGSHYALVKALYERGTPKLGKDHLRYTLGVDFALSRKIVVHRMVNVQLLRGPGYVYSDRPPGTAFLLVPFHAAGALCSDLLRLDPDQKEYATRFITALGILVFALINIGLVYWAGRLLGGSVRASIIGALCFATAGLAFKYSSMMFSHTPSVTTTLLGTCLLLHGLPKKHPLAFLFAAGFVMGYAVMIEYQNALFTIIFFVAWAIYLAQQKKFRSLLAVVAGGTVPAIILGYYHHICFGAIFTSTHRFNPTMPHNAHLDTIFAGHALEGLKMIFLAWYPNRMGILLVAPVFILGLAGLVLLRKRHTRIWAVLIAGIVYTLVIVHHSTITGGATVDCRYFFPVASLMALGIAPLYERLRQIQNCAAKVFLLATFAAIAIYSSLMSIQVTLDSKMGPMPGVDFWRGEILKYGTLIQPDNNVDKLAHLVVLPRYGAFESDYIVLPLPMP